MLEPSFFFFLLTTADAEHQGMAAPGVWEKVGCVKNSPGPSPSSDQIDTQ